MQNIRVACVSMNGFLGEPARSLRNIETFARKAASQRVELVLFPELVVHAAALPVRRKTGLHQGSGVVKEFAVHSSQFTVHSQEESNLESFELASILNV